ncbi:copper homeostasis protein CutC [Amycolatopsis pithecellobii]|uniref:PF03932 family protein CutC n=1 Tax=Amycolatopsis pithecellobii TaxID=664692 RepID=A0A6N7Z986_9PSEU|nr:copper homeostasis protein CutC [Amycolatopsis pithecellobii]MTD58294.1 hypothetical protein [Amycolatopsis pithecellobii]
MRIELSTDTVESAVVADKLGADRIELCCAGALGGLTPGPGLLAATLARCHRAEVHVLIRPREGDFAYSPSEVDAMLTHVRHAVRSGAAGVVVGALTARDELDTAVLADLIAAAGLPVTIHRAIDVCRDPVAAVEVAASLGVHRVLSSGGAPRAEDGIPVLRHMVAAAGDRLAVMACGGIRPHCAVRYQSDGSHGGTGFHEQVGRGPYPPTFGRIGSALAVAEETGVRDLHAAPRRPAPTSAAGYGAHALLDEEAARALIELVR